MLFISFILDNHLVLSTLVMGCRWSLVQLLLGVASSLQGHLQFQYVSIQNLSTNMMKKASLVSEKKHYVNSDNIFFFLSLQAGTL